MAYLTSPLTTYSDTTPQKRQITDVISLISPSDMPMVENLGGLDGAADKFRFVNESEKVVEWLEDTLIGLTGLLNGSIASTATTITAADGDNFQEGHIILIDSEHMWVSSVNNATEVITVTRAFQGSSASHADSATITIVGMARLEGAESDDIAFTDRTTGSNFTQILHQEVKVSRTQGQIAQYGISDEMAYQGDKVIPSLGRLLERHFFYNTVAKAGSATTPRAMGGYQAFVTTNKVSGATLAQSQFENAVMSAYSAGGDGPWSAYCAPANLQKVKNLYDSSNFLRIDRTENTLGVVIERILTPYGEVDLVLDRWAKTTEIPLIDPEHAGFSTLYPFTQEMLAKGGDYEKSEVVGEYTLCLRQDAAHAILTNVS
jgi:uncharacterized protein DUF5309